MIRQHDAEVIFESAGPTATATPAGGAAEAARAWRAAGPQLGDTDAIHTDRLNPIQAYQVFHEANQITSFPDAFTIAAGNEKKMESPLQRFHRLKSELAELSSDLEYLSNCDKESVWGVLQRETSVIAKDAESLETHPAWQAKGSFASQQLANLESRLDLPRPAASSTSAPSADMVELERRVHRLEVMLGLQMNAADASWALGGADAFPVLAAIQRLERKLSLCEPSALESVRAKANLLKWELEAMSGKKKDAQAGNEAKILDAMKRIEEVSSQVGKIQAFGEDLPALVLRLKTLESVHWSASTAHARLQALESDLRALAGQAREHGSLLTEVKLGLRSNLETMQKNVAHVEERFAQMLPN